MLEVMFEAPRHGRGGTIRVTKAMVDKRSAAAEAAAEAVRDAQSGVGSVEAA
jgi:hypothetical protein